MIDPITSDPRVANRRRPLNIIAREIKRDWTHPFFGAVPYIDAMLQLHSPDDTYIHESARGIIRYFLANAGTWRGSTARRVKAELKELLK